MMRPGSPQETLRQLCELFPHFAEAWKAVEAPPEDGLVDDVYYEWTHHQVMSEFLVFFSKHHVSFSRQQLEAFGKWINEVVADGGKLENAVSTCFLEHSRQVSIDRVLEPFLSREAKAKSHA